MGLDEPDSQPRRVLGLSTTAMMMDGDYIIISTISTFTSTCTWFQVFASSYGNLGRESQDVVRA